ncbi:MAG: zinc ribbon domain-containing protein [Clostridia bacterium]|nr:zinc ribbon domain-containing protein [Clostridia bacterium]
MENTEMKFCQSCCMPMDSEGVLGTNSDGSKSHDYCHYCYENGAFTKEETMDEMIESCVPFVSKGNPYPDEETARKAMQEIFPNLKRWK